MPQYIVSDIHGNKDKYLNLLSTLNYSPSRDKLIILGDVLDRGADGVAILKDLIIPMVEKGNAEMLLGNHELFCKMFLEGNLSENTWEVFGGEYTIRAIKQMASREKESLLTFINSLPLYAEVKSSIWGDVICTHSGVHADYLMRNEDASINIKKSIDIAYNQAGYSLLCGVDLHYLSEKNKKSLDNFMIVGHVPSNRLNDTPNNYNFYRTPYYIDIDSGCGYDGGKLGCYILDTDEEIYI